MKHTNKNDKFVCPECRKVISACKKRRHKKRCGYKPLKPRNIALIRMLQEYLRGR